MCSTDSPAAFTLVTVLPRFLPDPADVQAGIAEAASSERKLSAPAPVSLKPPHQATLKAPPPDSSSTAPASHNPAHAQSAVTQTQDACHQEKFCNAADAAAAPSPLAAVTHNGGPLDGTSPMVDCAAVQQLAASEAADHVAEPTSAVPGPSSQDTASGSRPSFILMLQSKMDQRRQQRRESQSASDSSLSSVHTTRAASADKAEASVNSGASDGHLRI